MTHTHAGRASFGHVIENTSIIEVLRRPLESATYTASTFMVLCKDKLGIRQSMGRVGSCFDNAAAESFFSTLEHEVLSRHHFATRAEARSVVLAWCHEFYNTSRRHSSAAMMSPDDYEHTAEQPMKDEEAA
jgi:putative transposase